MSKEVAIEKLDIGRRIHVAFWGDEATAHRQLVQVRISDGVDDVEPLQRDEYVDENIYVDQSEWVDDGATV